MRWAGLFLLLVGIGVTQACAKRRPPPDQEVLLELSPANNRREFYIGETIPIKLSFSSRFNDHYQLNEAHYDRSGRMNYERFKAEKELSAHSANTGSKPAHKESVTVRCRYRITNV